MSHHPLDLLRDQAMLRLPPPVAAYLSGAAGDGVTDRRNAEDFGRWALVPAVGVDVSTVDTRTSLPGVDLAHPVLLAPTALHELYHPGGEGATARGGAAADALVVLSSDASQTIESSARELPDGFYAQMLPWRDRGLMQEYVRRAEQVGARALVVTLDSAVGGLRYHQQRHLSELPSTLSRANLAASRPVVPGADLSARASEHEFRLMAPGYVDAAFTWSRLEELVASTTLPVIGKGIVRPRDAVAGIRAGLAGISVSNHGGRNLDNAVSTISALPGVVAAVAAVDATVPVIVDGGVRRGSDVLIALALGARAVMIGRPYVWGLAVEGAAGVRTVVETLVRELRVAMALCGVTSLRDVDADVLSAVAERRPWI